MRVKHLTRTEMFPQALDFILKENPDFGLRKENFEAAERTRVYNLSTNQYENYCKAINKYLDKHYLMYMSTDEIILVVRKPVNDEYRKNDFMFYTPDFAKDAVAMFVR